MIINLLPSLLMMRYKYLLLLILMVVVIEIYTLRLTVYSTITNSKRFLVFSDEHEAKAIFRRVFQKPKARIHRLHWTYPYHSTDEMVARKQICEDVSNSYAFRQDGKLSYEKYTNPLYRLIKNFKYPDVKVPIVQLSSESIETMFQCLAQDSRQNVSFYVSDEYNVNTDSSDRLNHLVGRFIFQSFTKDWPRLYGLVELPANAFSDPDRNIESLYLARRGSKSVESTAKQDALCGLSKNNLQRICVAVFNAEYFAENFQFSNVYEVKGYCEQKTVSFQTSEGKAKADGRDLKEWMLSCKPNENESIFDYWQSRWTMSCKLDDASKECTFRYWLSHAYHTNQIFVYLWDSKSEDVFLENLSVNVRLAYGDPENRIESHVKESADTSVSKRGGTRLDDMPWMTDISVFEKSMENFSTSKNKSIRSLTKWVISR